MSVTLTDKEPALIINDKKIIEMKDNKNILIKGDNNSQEITFKVKDNQDGELLSTKRIYVRCVKDNYAAIENCTIKKDEVDSDYAIISWPVSNKATAFSGEVSFAVVAESENYIWQTVPAKLKIENGLTDTSMIDKDKANAADYLKWQSIE